MWITPIVRMEVLYSARSSTEYVELETDLDALRILRNDRAVTDAAMSAIGEPAERSDGYHRVPFTDALIAAAAVLINRPGLRLSDRCACEASPLDRRVDHPHDSLEQLRIRIVLGDRITEPGKRRRMELRQLNLQRQVCRGQIPEPLEQLIEHRIGDWPQLPCGSPAGMSQESTSKALLRRAALHTAAALRLTTRTAQTGLVAPNLRHNTIVTRSPVETRPRLSLELTEGSTSHTSQTLTSRDGSSRA